MIPSLGVSIKLCKTVINFNETPFSITAILHKIMDIKMTCFESRNDGRGLYLCIMHLFKILVN